MSKKVRHQQQDNGSSKKRKRFCKTKAGNEIGCDYESSAFIVMEKIMDEIVEYATKKGMDSYFLLKHFQFTNEEIEEYFERLGIDFP